MKQTLLYAFLAVSLSGKAQSVMQSVNSGSIITSNSSVSVGEIIVVPENPNQSSSGIIGIFAQNNQTLEVPQLELSGKVTVFPNPTTAGITFKTEVNLSNEKVSVYNLSGQLVAKKQINESNSMDLSELKAGVYLIQFTDKKIKSFKIIKR